MTLLKKVRAVLHLGDDAGVIPVVRLEGPIAAGSGGVRAGLNVNQLEGLLSKAFETKDAKAVALSINSPGGSPAQSEYLGARIRQLAAKHELPVLAFCEDVAASGGYWLACAADEIFVATTSMVGSIGVISAGFGATELIGKIGVERRVFTAGENKHRLDMFEDIRDGDVEWLTALQEDIKGAFVGWVRERRGGKLSENPTLFTGEVWIGQKSVDEGLADAVGILRTVLAERYPNAQVLPLTPAKPLLARLTGGVSVVEGTVAAAISAVESKGMWARFGV